IRRDDVRQHRRAEAGGGGRDGDEARVAGGRPRTSTVGRERDTAGSTAVRLRRTCRTDDRLAGTARGIQVEKAFEIVRSKRGRRRRRHCAARGIHDVGGLLYLYPASSSCQSVV